MRKSPVLIFSLTIIIIAGLTITGISAYFISTHKIQNATSIGHNTITIQENFVNPEISPGEVTVITKKVEIRNTGPTNSAIRVRADFSSSDILDYTTVDYNTEKWQQEGEYWYYKTPLAPGSVTEPLFNKLTLNKPTEDQVSDFDVYVYAESKSCKDNASVAEMISLF